MTGKEITETRRLRFEIFRYNPLDPESEPHMQTYELDEAPYMSIFIALSQIREQQDPSLQFDFACRSAICGSCGMMVNGRSRHGGVDRSLDTRERGVRSGRAGTAHGR